MQLVGQEPLTTTVKAALAALPEASLATQSTVVAPSGNKLPEGGLQTTMMLVSQLSVAVTVKFITSPSGGAHWVTMVPGVLMTGAEVSATVTVKEHSAELRKLSNAEQWTVVTPRGNRLPEAGMLFTVTGPLGLEAITWKSTMAP